MFEPQKRLLYQPGLSVGVDERRVGVIGGQDSIFSHLEPAETQLVPPSRQAEGPKHDVVVERVGEVVGEGPHAAEEVEGPPPVPLPLEEHGLLLGAEVGEERVEGFIVESVLAEPGGGGEGGRGGVAVGRRGRGDC